MIACNFWFVLFRVVAEYTVELYVLTMLGGGVFFKNMGHKGLCHLVIGEYAEIWFACDQT